MTLLAFASVLLMTLDHRYQHLEMVRGALSALIYPLQSTLTLPLQAGGAVADAMTTRTSLVKENERLRTEHLLLKVQLQKFYALESENARLRRLLHSAREVSERVLIAELVAVDLDPFTRQVVLNRGSSDGVFVGQPMLDAKGIAGQIIHVGPFSSTALLISDPAHAIPVQVNRTGQRAIAVGTGGSGAGLELRHIPNNADLQVGDLLVSSGLGGRFPPGYPVGRVASFHKNPAQPFARVTAESEADLERFREALLVWTQTPTPPPAATGQPPSGATSTPAAPPTSGTAPKAPQAPQPASASPGPRGAQ